MEKAETVAGAEKPGVNVNAPPSTAVRRVFFRSTLFQILVVGGCAFTAPGIWGAMNGLGVGGTEDPNLINAANALLYAFMTVTCFSGPWVTNLIGFRWTLAIGSLGYPLYAAGLHVNNHSEAIWFVYFGAVACGISAGFFWSVEGAIATGYPEAHKRGCYLATWLTFRDLGMLVGGAISLALNHKTGQKGQVGYSTYQAFIAIQCLGFFLALLLSTPEQVQRDDGTRIDAPRGLHWRVQAKEVWQLARSRSILLLVPLFWYFGWIQAYPGTYLETYFTIRSRGLGSFMSAVVMVLGTWIGGSLVDLPWTRNRKTRAITTYILVATINSATWIWSVIIQNDFRHTKPVVDWSDQSTFGPGFGVYMFQYVSLGMVENYIYWCISNLSDSPGQQIRYTSLLRGIETAAVAVGFGVQAVPTALIATASINLALWFIALPFSYFATLQVVHQFDKTEAEANQTMRGN
ncbi:DUF895 domain membrane protein [Viridothelium virens]|uniref:DUF895 domain membrane protein n=1 Tax=Viridothelium virens TaxID=1048519 RepID=A0A6A6H5A2_VIRVR|nr:DUF895 domain membrane protein [Viridothelium virens]